LASRGVLQIDRVEAWLMTNPFDGRTVLVVEDDGLVREDVADWLRQQGWIVLENALGAGALQWPPSSSLHGYQPRPRHHRMGCLDAGRASNPDLAVIYASGGPKDQARLLPQSVFCPSLRRRKI
jgi:hypothetical protein